MRKIIFALLAALLPAVAVAQSSPQFPQTMPANTVYGRLGVSPGPGQPVPVTSLLSAAQQSAANRVLAGPTSGGTGAATFRSLLYGDFPQMAAGTLLGNPTSAPAQPQAFAIQNLPNLSTPNATLDFFPIYDHTTGQIKYSSPSQLPGLGSPLAQNNAWTGTNDFQSRVTFGGVPFFDAKSSANGCSAAVGDGVTDDTAALQCKVTYLTNTYGGGRLYLPPGTYLVSGGTFAVTNGVILEGAGMNVSAIKTNTNTIAVQFFNTAGGCPTGGHNGGLERLSVYGYQNASATQPAVKIWDNCLVNIRYSRIWYGSYALYTTGSDGTYENSFICGYTGCVYSGGSNWYVRDKLDSAGVAPTSASFTQGANYSGLTVAENRFVLTDLSVGGATYSLYVDDSNNNGVMAMYGGVIDSPIFINHIKVLQLSDMTIGTTSFNVVTGSALQMTGSYAYGGATTIAGGGVKSCAANISFTNC